LSKLQFWYQYGFYTRVFPYPLKIFHAEFRDTIIQLVSRDAKHRVSTVTQLGSLEPN